MACNLKRKQKLQCTKGLTKWDRKKERKKKGQQNKQTKCTVSESTALVVGKVSRSWGAPGEESAPHWHGRVSCSTLERDINRWLRRSLQADGVHEQGETQRNKPWIQTKNYLYKRENMHRFQGNTRSLSVRFGSWKTTWAVIPLSGQSELGLSLGQPGLMAWGPQVREQSICIYTIGSIAAQYCF